LETFIFIFFEKASSLYESLGYHGKIFDSQDKANKYVSEHKDENLVNINDIDWSIEECEVE
jgi:hypothetical protein